MDTQRKSDLEIARDVMRRRKRALRELAATKGDTFMPQREEPSRE